MRRDFLRTLFSRMLATYLTVTLGLIVLVGVTVIALFQSQLRYEMRELLTGELAEISALCASVHASELPEESAAAELEIIARQSDGLIEIYGADGTHDTYFADDKWQPAAERMLGEAE